jgi:hypothetical protein
MQQNQRVRKEGEWSHSVGPYRYRIRLFQAPNYSGGNICVEIRDTRFPGQYRYRNLSLGHADRERAVKYAKVMSRWWKQTGHPPKITARRGRGPLPVGLLD